MLCLHPIRRGKMVFAATLLIATTGMAFAQEQRSNASSPVVHAPVSQASGKIPCTCRAMGSSFEVGTEVCLNSATYRCVMDQNVTSWRQTKEGCPIS